MYAIALLGFPEHDGYCKSQFTVRAIANENSVLLIWSVVPAASYYTIYRSNKAPDALVAIGKVPSGLANCRDAGHYEDYGDQNGDSSVSLHSSTVGLGINQTFYYAVSYTDKTGKESSKTPTVHATTHLLPPAELVAVPINHGIVLGWDETINGDKYNIYRSRNASYGFVKINKSPIDQDQLDLKVQMFTDKGLVNGRKYYYEVTALLGAKEGPHSNIATCIPRRPRLNSTMTVHRARRFFKSIGYTKFGALDAQFPASLSAISNQPDDIEYWILVNKNKDSAFGCIYIQDYSGAVTRFTDAHVLNDNIGGHLSSKNDLIIGQSAFSKSKSERVAIATLQASGLLEHNHFFPAKRFVEHAVPKTHIVYQYWFRRECKGIAYRDNSVWISVDSTSYAASDLESRLYGFDPKIIAPKVSQSSAISIANSFLNTTIYAGAAVRGVLKAIDAPNTVWSKYQHPGPNRLTWDVQYSLEGGYCEVSIDASSGRVIGGQVAVF